MNRLLRLILMKELLDDWNLKWMILLTSMMYSQTPLLNVLLSNVMEIGNSYLDNVREEDI